MGIGQPLPDRLLRLMSSKDRAKLGKAGVLSEEALAKAEARSEKELQELIYTWLTTFRGVRRVIRSRMDRKTTYAVGTPDFLFSFGGTAMAWEIKLPTGAPTPDQMEALLQMQYDGWNVAVIHSLAEARSVIDLVFHQ